MSKTLEAMARSLFKAWFVDFEPVRVKMEGRNAATPSNWQERFFQGAMVQDAVLRSLDVIGEASAKGPNDDSRAHEPRGNRHAD